MMDSQRLLHVIFFVSVLICQFQGDTPSFARAQEATDPAEHKMIEKTLREKGMDWGSFYDPKNIFCGPYDCYKILGFDYTTFYTEKPDSAAITKSFRTLSRSWHPDKNKEKGAKEIFVKLKKAHEILKSKSKRKEYDYFRDRHDEYFKKYGSEVKIVYAPQSDVRFILVSLVALFTVLLYGAQYQRWLNIANHIIRAAVEDLSFSQGGSSESMEVRKKALEIYESLKEEEAKNKESNGASKLSLNKQKKMARLNKQEIKKREQDELKEIIQQLVYEMDDFGGGFRKPKFMDLFFVKVALLPLTVYRASEWRLKFYFRRMKGMPLSDGEIEQLTKNAVGEISWDAADNEKKEHLKKLELWISKNMKTWLEEKAINEEDEDDDNGARKQLRQKKKIKKQS